MEFIGEYLKNIRIEKKITLKLVASELKISINLIENIEKDYFPDYLNQVYLIGHLRSYAKYLQLDHNEIIQNYKIQNLYFETDQKNQISKPINSFKSFSVPKFISYFSVIIFASGFYFLFIKTNNFQSEYAMTPDVPENLIFKLEEMEMNIALAKIKQDKEQALIKTQEKKIIESQSVIYSSSSAIASLPIKEKTDKINNSISLKFTNPTWIQLRNEKDEIVFSKLMNKSDEYLYNTNNNYTLTSGNAGNIIIALDNVIIGKAGKAGEVVDSLIINKNFNQQ